MENGELIQNIILEKSEDFAVRIINLNKYLVANFKEFVLSNQLLRAGTSIGANVSEAQEAQSGADFIAKFYIAIKECRETRYWLKLLYRTEFLNYDQYNSLNNDNNELHAIMTAIIRTKKENLQKTK